MPRDFVPLYYWRGECHTLRRWAQILDISRKTLLGRTYRGLSGDRLFAPVVVYIPRSTIVPVMRKQLERVMGNRRSLGLDTLHLEIEMDHLQAATTPLSFHVD